ncbi:hypothetical protein MPSEU_000176700 [Mayamaea pseudoterrestris]|nr:hypothetical protein MPSEU_000176700 [Mayamaea pseudoterrestris]
MSSTEFVIPVLTLARGDPSFFRATMRIRFNQMPVVALLLGACCLHVSHGFIASTLKVRVTRQHTTSLTSTSSDDLLTAINKHQDDATILSLIEKLEASYHVDDDEDNSRFEPLLGLYHVSRTLSTRSNASPVGGTWTKSTGVMQKLLRTKAAWQHIIPASKNTAATKNISHQDNNDAVVAQVVNHVHLETLKSRVQIHVLLRGDAVPLTSEERSNADVINQNKKNNSFNNKQQQQQQQLKSLSPLAVKVHFDPPRICFTNRNRRPLLSLSVGPKTSVLLDSTFCNDELRIGMGGTSGTRFVFQRVDQDANAMEASDYEALLAHRPVSKRKSLSVLGVIVMSGINLMLRRNVVPKLVGGTLSALSLACASLIACSSGGIERDNEDSQSSKWRRNLNENDSASSTRAKSSATTTANTRSKTALVFEQNIVDSKYIAQTLDCDELAQKYASIDNVEERAFQILSDLGMLTDDADAR